MRRFLTFSLASALLLVSWPARAQQWIQIPVCGGALPSGLNPSAATIAVNPSGQLCVLTGTISVTVPTPPAASFPQPDSVVVTTVAGVISGAYANGAIVAEGSTADGAATATFTAGSIITWLRGIFENTLTPISVSGSFTANQTGNNIALVASQQIASPSTYGVAPVGSVLGVNAFITNAPTVNVASPLDVGVVNSNPNGLATMANSSPVVIASDQTPVAVNIATASSPLTTNLAQVQNRTIASPSTYGVAPVGSVQGVNAFVTNGNPNGLATMANSSPVVVASDQTPISVNIAPASSPVNVTGSFTTNVSSPLGVNIASTTPINVTLATSPVAVSGSFTATQTGNNIVQWGGQLVASATTYGVSPVGSVGAVNAFVTNNVNVTPPTPLQITLPASPISVGIAGPTPLNVTVGGIVSPQNMTLSGPSPLSVGLPATPFSVVVANSPTVVPTGTLAVNVVQATGQNIDQISGQQIASPSTYGVAPVGSVQGVNAFVTNNVNVTTPTPLQVTLPASPVSVGVANSSLNVSNTPVGSPQNVTVATSPVAVTIASSPVNVTGNFTSTPASPQNVNIDQINGQLIASPSTYGLAPVGSVGAVNAFVTNNVNVTPPTPLQITLPASPISVGLPTTPLNVTLVAIPGSPQNMTLTGSPVSVGLATGINITQLQGTNLASPSTYGAAPVGSVLGVNAFVTNNVNVTTPTPLQVTLPASPISVGLAGPTPLNVTIATSPVAVSGSFTATQTGNNIVQWGGQLVASPSTYGVAPVGSAPGVNAFVTNGNANGQATMANSSPIVIASNQSALPVTGINITQVASQQIASPSTYGVAPVGSVQGVNAFVTSLPATPLNVTVASGLNLVQVQSINIASPSTYGVAPVGSVAAVNAFMTNANPNGSQSSANSQPVVIANDQTPVSVNILAGSVTNSNVIAWTATTSTVVTNAALALGATPGIVGVHQFNGAECSPVAQGVATPQVAFLQVFDVTPHASGSDVTLGTTNPKIILPIATSASTPSMNPFIIAAPGAQFTKGITVAFTTVAKGASSVNVNLVCSFVYN